jgi:putative transposase
MIPGSIPVIVRSFKAAVTKRMNLQRRSPSQPVWQRNYYKHILSTEKEYDNIVNYVAANWEVQDEYFP